MLFQRHEVQLVWLWKQEAVCLVKRSLLCSLICGLSVYRPSLFFSCYILRLAKHSLDETLQSELQEAVGEITDNTELLMTQLNNRSCSRCKNRFELLCPSASNSVLCKSRSKKTEPESPLLPYCFCPCVSEYNTSCAVPEDWELDDTRGNDEFIFFIVVFTYQYHCLTWNQRGHHNNLEHHQGYIYGGWCVRFTPQTLIFALVLVGRIWHRCLAEELLTTLSDTAVGLK